MSGPNLNSFCAQFYKERWRLHYPESHLFHFTVNHLTEVLNEHGFQIVAEVYHYLETPYASPEDDILRIAKDIMANRHKDVESMSAESPPFWENRYTAIWQKN